MSQILTTYVCHVSKLTLSWFNLIQRSHNVTGNLGASQVGCHMLLGRLRFPFMVLHLINLKTYSVRRRRTVILEFERRTPGPESWNLHSYQEEGRTEEEERKTCLFKGSHMADKQLRGERQKEISEKKGEKAQCSDFGKSDRKKTKFSSDENRQAQQNHMTP